MARAGFADQSKLLAGCKWIAVAVLGISRAGAYELARSRDFPSLSIGSRIVIPKDKFIEWIEHKSAEKSSGV